MKVQTMVIAAALAGAFIPVQVQADSLQAAELSYVIKSVGALDGRPVQVFSLDGNLYLQMPDGVQVLGAKSLGGRHLSRYVSPPYVVVEGGRGGVILKTNKGSYRVLPKGWVPPRQTAPARTPKRVAQATPNKRIRVKTSRVEMELARLNRAVDSALERAEALKHRSSANHVAGYRKKEVVAKSSPHAKGKKSFVSKRGAETKAAVVRKRKSAGRASSQPKVTSASSARSQRIQSVQRRAPQMKWHFENGRVSELLRGQLNRLHHRLVWKPSIDFEVPVPVDLVGKDLPDMLNRVSTLYGLPIALCRGNHTVVVYPQGTPSSYMTCGTAAPLTIDPYRPTNHPVAKIREKIRDNAESFFLLEERGSF